ncbi:MAG: phage major capsid protein [Candidatus Hodarchaeales archaeon]
MGKTITDVKNILKEIQTELRKSANTSLEDLAKDLISKQFQTLRKGEFDVEPLTPSAEDLGVKEEVLRKADDLYICSVLLNKRPDELRLWDRNKSEMSELRKAMSSTTGVGGDWIPTGFSNVIQKRVRLALKVGALHSWVPMPTNPYTLPIDGSDSEAYLIPESLKDESVKIKSSTPGTSALTFTSKKLAARSLFSTDISEDSIIPILPFLKGKIVDAMKRAIEKAVIDGDTTETHMDSDVVSSFDFRKAFKGYRRLAYDLGTAWRKYATNLQTSLQNLREDMGVYGADTDGLVWVTSLAGYHAMKNQSDVYTVDKYGPKAVILTGELGRFENIPIVVSEYVRNDLAATGFYTGAGNTKTVIILVHKSSLAFGDRRKVTLKTDELIQTDQTVLVTTQRLDFRSLQASTYPVVGVLYNV